MLTAGVDVGSVAAKAVIFEPESQTIAGWAVLPTGWNPRQAGEDALDAALAHAEINRAELAQSEANADKPNQTDSQASRPALNRASLGRVVGTGYGRISLPFVQKSITEITCHARGAAWLFPDVGTVLDIGGQDSKVITVEKGGVRDFVMNDKCAAGTGRFLQVVSGILDMDLEQLGQAAGQGRPAAISSMCAVFAETEIIGLLAGGCPPQDIAAGVFVSIARRMRALAGRLALSGQCVFTGGLASSPAFSALLSQELGLPVRVPKQPQLVGALGAALLAARL